MLCCVLAGTLIAFAYRLRAWITRRDSGCEPGFAPPARWNAPGEPAVRAAPDDRRRLTPEWVAGAYWLAGGVATYPLLIHALGRVGVASVSVDSESFPGRTMLAFVGGATIAVLRYRYVAARNRTRVHHVGVAMGGMGTAWTALSFVDVHVFGTVHVAGSLVTRDLPTPHFYGHGTAMTLSELLFHAGGPALILTGWILIASSSLRATPFPSRIPVKG